MARISFTPAIVPLRSLNPANDTVQAGRYLATTLSAVDADLAAGNIKDGVDIFGKIGTVVPGSLDEDVEGDAVFEGYDDGISGQTAWLLEWESSPIVSKVLTFDANSLAFAAGFISCYARSINTTKLQLTMGGVLMQESAFISDSSFEVNYVLRDFKALSDEQTCFLGASGLAIGDELRAYGAPSLNDNLPAAIAVGSVKLA